MNNFEITHGYGNAVLTFDIEKSKITEETLSFVSFKLSGGERIWKYWSRQGV